MTFKPQSSLLHAAISTCCLSLTAFSSSALADKPDPIISWLAVQPLPAQAADQKRFPFHYVFKNFSADQTATDVQVKTRIFSDLGFHVDENNCSERSQLAPGDSCVLRGSFRHNSSHPVPLATMSLSLSYQLAGSAQSVGLSASVQHLSATAPLRSGHKQAPLAEQWSWPAHRFSPYIVDNTPCEEGLRDRLTGLIWSQKSSASAMDDAGADAYIKHTFNDAELCGMDQWRLPTISELASLINYQDTSSPGYWLNQHGFAGIHAGDKDYYLSSTHYYGPNAARWKARLAYGHLDYPKTNSYVLAVHDALAAAEKADPSLGAQVPAVAPASNSPGARWPEHRFRAFYAADGQVCNEALYDVLTQVIWLKNGALNDNSKYNLPDAEKVIAGLSLCQLSDWQLPSIQQLKSLINYDQDDPAAWLNSQGFEQMQIDEWYWTDSKHNLSYNGNIQWVVLLKQGNVSYSHTTGYNRHILPMHRVATLPVLVPLTKQ